MFRFKALQTVRQAMIALAVIPLLAMPIVGVRLAHADTAVSPAAAPPPTVVLPLGRTRYFAGETILVASANPAGAHKLSLVCPDGRIAPAQASSGHLWKIATAGMPVGRYKLLLDGVESGAQIEVESAVRLSPASIGDDNMPSPAVDAGHDALRKTLAETGINSIVGALSYGTSASDDFASTGTMYWLNPTTRPISFFPARVYEPEVHNFRQRLAQIAQINDKYPTFGGFEYDFDPGGFLDRSGLLFYWGFGSQEPALRNYEKVSVAAIYSDFTHRTGLIAPTSAEFINYLASIGHPEYGPAIDYPEFRWITSIAQNSKPMSPAEQSTFEKRLSTWTDYLCSINGETYTGHQVEIKRIDPTLASTADIDLEATVREGHWQERSYAPLDFRYVEAWDDQTEAVNSPYEWLFVAALADMGRGQSSPVWVASSLGPTFDLATYPGKLMRVTADNLAYGGRGVGFALEGFSNLLGGMNAATNWPTIKGKASGADLASGREFLNRYAPLQAQCADVRKVGVLLSLSQYSQQQTIAGLFTPQGHVFLALARLGYTPRFISEDDIAAGRADGLRDLVIVNQTAALPDAVLTHLAAMQKTGLRVFVDQPTTISIPGAVKVGLNLPFKDSGKPFNWGVVNTEPLAPQTVVEQVNASITPNLLTALGDRNRAPMVSSAGAATKTAVYSLDGGPSAQYVVAVDDALGANPSAWQRMTENLTVNHVSGTLYDVTGEKEVGPIAPGSSVPCEFNALSARLYAVLAKRVVSTKLSATQSVVAGGVVTVKVAYAAADGRTIPAAIPFMVSICAPDGTAQDYDRSTTRAGVFVESFPIGRNGTAGAYRIRAHCRLNGATVELPVTVRPSPVPQPMVVKDAVIVRGTDAIKSFLANHRTVEVPIFESPSRQTLLAAAHQLRTMLALQRVTADVLQDPVVTTYVQGYDPSPAELADNDRAERGETIGKISNRTVNGNDYFAQDTGYVYGKPLILLDLVSPPVEKAPVATTAVLPSPPAANPMASSLSTLLWPNVTASFPGPGRAVVQLVRSPFNLGTDALVIQATDVAGLTAGINSLSNLPSDSITPGVQQARSTLLRQLSIGQAAQPSVAAASMTAKGLSAATMKPDPLSIDFSAGPVPPDATAVTEPASASPAVHKLPAAIPVQELVAYYQPSDKLIQAWNPGGAWEGDLRFVDADAVTVDSGVGGPVHIAIDGLFRYTDRAPRSQSTWEDIIALYLKSTPRDRKQMSADVYVDGTIVGSLNQLTTAGIDPMIDTPGGGLPPHTVHEDGVTQISGTVTLPAGVHTVMVRPRNIVDSQVNKVTLTP